MESNMELTGMNNDEWNGHNDGLVSLLLYVLLKRANNHIVVTFDDAVKLPKGWRDEQIVVEHIGGVINYKLTEPVETAPVA
jgi:hypothetical protein